MRKINIDDYIGKVHGKLTAIQEAEPAMVNTKRKNGKRPVRRIKCLCECGNEVIVSLYDFNKRGKKSCGYCENDAYANEVLKKYIEFNYKIKKTARYFNVSYTKIRNVLTKIGEHQPKKHLTWTKESVLEESLKYNLKTRFRENSRSAYDYALKHNFMDECCEHMMIIGNSHRRLVYVYEFEDRSVYVGLTMDVGTRHLTHTTNQRSPVFKHMKNTNLTPEHKILTDYLDYKDAQLIEKNLIDDYRKNDWNVLNIKDGGQLGGWQGYLTDERLHQEALKYKSYTEFRKNSFFAFRKIQKNKLFYMLEHLERKQKKVKPPKKGWTDESRKQHMEKIQKKGLEVLKTMRDNNIPTNTGRPLNSVETVDDFINKPTNIKIRNMVLDGYSVRQIEETLNVSKTTIVKVRKHIK